MSVHDSKLQVRLMVTGLKQVGKTTLVRTYTGDPCKEANTSCTNHLLVDGMKVEQHILDTDGKHSAVMAWSHGIIIVFSVDSKKSFEYAAEILKRVGQVNMKNAYTILVGNKVRKQNSKLSNASENSLKILNQNGTTRRISHDDDPMRRITRAQAEQLAIDFESEYIEFSAACDQRYADYVFTHMTEEVVRRREKVIKQQRTPNMIRKMFNVLKQHT